jgi:hypothetical protein
MRVQGIYDGEKIVLVEPLPLPPNSRVEVIVPGSRDSIEESYWEKLAGMGLVMPAPTDAPEAGETFEPVSIEGEPVSRTIIENRR